MCGRLLAPLSGIALTTRATHSLHYTLPRQFHDDTVSTSVQPLVSTQETYGTMSSGYVSGPQLSHGLISSHVPAGPPVPISFLDAAVQATPPCNASQDVSTQTSDQPVSPLSFDVGSADVFPQCSHLISG